MKRLFQIMAAIVMAVTISSCAQDSELKQAVNAINKVCPYSMGDYMTVEKAEYDGHTVTLFYSTAEGLINYESIRANEQAFRTNMLISYANNDDEGFKKMFDAIIKAKADFRVEFSTAGGESFSITFTADELASHRPGENADPESMLKVIADNTKLQTPMTVDDGMVMSDVFLDEDYFTYVYTCDEIIYDMELLSENVSMVKEVLMEEVRTMDNDPIAKQTCELLKATGRGFAYRYVGSVSGKSFTVYVDSYELN